MNATEEITKAQHHADIACVFREFSSECARNRLGRLADICNDFADLERDLVAAEVYEQRRNRVRTGGL